METSTRDITIFFLYEKKHFVSNVIIQAIFFIIQLQKNRKKSSAKIVYISTLYHIVYDSSYKYPHCMYSVYHIVFEMCVHFAVF